MSLLCKVICSTLFLATVGAATADGQVFEGTRQFGLSLWAPEVSHPTDTWIVTVTAWNSGLGPDLGGQALIEVDGAATVVDGAGRREIPAMRTKPVLMTWRLVLKKRELGRVTVRGIMRVDGSRSDSYDVHEAVLSFDIASSEIRVVDSRTIRQLSVRHGRKFRYAGPALVAVESDEDAEPLQVESRAEMTRGNIIYCEGCGLTNPVDVPVVLTVGRGGNVTWISRVGDIGGKPAVPAVRSAIEKGLAEFEFRPAISRGRPISDFVFMSVRLAPEQSK